MLVNRAVFKVKREDLAPGLRSLGADKHANRDSGTDTKRKMADRETDCASNRYAKTNPTGHDFGVFLAG